MDRNLGAMDIYYHGNDELLSVLWFQYGRKDPFPGPKRIYIMQSDGSYQYKSWNDGTYDVPNTINANRNNVPYSIKHPLTFIKGTYWTYNDIYNPTSYNSSIIWNDPYIVNDMGKSFFDPCPFGWKMPKKGTWDGFESKNRYSWNDPLSSGGNYFPNGTNDRSAGHVFYPAYGELTSTKDLGSKGSYGWTQCYTTYSIDLAYYFNVYSGGANTTLWSRWRGNGLSVRCVLE